MCGRYNIVNNGDEDITSIADNVAGVEEAGDGLSNRVRIDSTAL